MRDNAMADTDSKLASSVQTLNLVDSVSDAVKHLIKAIFLRHLARSEESEIGVWSDIQLFLQENVRILLISIRRVEQHTSMAIILRRSSSASSHDYHVYQRSVKVTTHLP